MFNKKCLNTDMKNNVKLIDEEVEEEVEEEEVKEEDDDDEDGIEVEEITIEGKKYFLEGDMKTNGTIYKILDDDDIGEVVGRVYNGVVKFE